MKKSARTLPRPGDLFLPIKAGQQLHNTVREPRALRRSLGRRQLKKWRRLRRSAVLPGDLIASQTPAAPETR